VKSIKSNSRREAGQEHERSHLISLSEKFWMAPEHLSRSHGLSSIKGDVFSFGIILYEVKTRSLPYSSVLYNPINALSPEGKLFNSCSL